MYILHYTCLNIADRISPLSAGQIAMGARGQDWEGKGKGTSLANSTMRVPLLGQGVRDPTQHPPTPTPLQGEMPPVSPEERPKAAP